jgi:hypothetical protein
VALEYRIGERHSTPRGRWHRPVVEYDSVAVSEQTMRHGRPNIANAANDYPCLVHFHARILQQWTDGVHGAGRASSTVVRAAAGYAFYGEEFAIELRKRLDMRANAVRTAHGVERLSILAPSCPTPQRVGSRCSCCSGDLLP